MIGIVLVGVLVDRATLTFRTLTVAALCVLLLAPEAVVHPSFQMSFAATLALVAGYQFGLPWMSKGGDTPLAARIALWGGRELLGLILVSLLAGTATIPYIAYHFHRVSPYGVVANLAAMPIVSAWVMPLGIFGLVAMPLGFDGSCWWLMGLGIDWMVKVALWTTTLPGALGRTTAFDGGTLLLCSLGLVTLCLLKTPLRFIGTALVCAAIVMMIKAPQPDVLIAADGTAVAIRGSEGRLAMIKSGSDTFAFREWLAADGDSRSPQEGTLAAGIKCDDAGCVGRLKEGGLVAFAKSPQAVEEDCRRAAIVISTRDIPSNCGALVVDRQALRSSGATALRRLSDGQFEIIAARPRGYNRPWATARLEESDPTITVPPRDATPRTEDLELGD
jgi:competence protein ComEC